MSSSPLPSALLGSQPVVASGAAAGSPVVRRGLLALPTAAATSTVGARATAPVVASGAAAGSPVVRRGLLALPAAPSGAPARAPVSVRRSAAAGASGSRFPLPSALLGPHPVAASGAAAGSAAVRRSLLALPTTTSVPAAASGSPPVRAASPACPTAPVGRVHPRAAVPVVTAGAGIAPPPVPLAHRATVRRQVRRPASEPPAGGAAGRPTPPTRPGQRLASVARPRVADELATDAVRRMVMGPPPSLTGISSPAATPAPPVRSAPAAGDGTIRRSLLDRLHQREEAAMSNGGMPAVPTGGEYAPVIRRWAGGAAGEVTGVRTGTGLESAAVAGAHSLGGQPGIGSGAPILDFDLLVDRVVRALEQRVLDELERRGRRHLPGVF